MSDKIIITCLVDSERKMYGKRLGQTQVKFKFESNNKEFHDFMMSRYRESKKFMLKPQYIDQKFTYDNLKMKMNKHCEELSEVFEHKNWKFVYKVSELGDF